MKRKRVNNYVWASLATGVIVASFILGMCSRRGGNVGKYVVMDKYRNTIYYKRVGGIDMHVMVFDTREAARDNLMYTYVNPGDTICGLTVEMNEPVALPITSGTPVIKSINGRNYDDLRKSKFNDSVHSYHTKLQSDINQKYK